MNTEQPAWITRWGGWRLAFPLWVLVFLWSGCEVSQTSVEQGGAENPSSAEVVDTRKVAEEPERRADEGSANLSEATWKQVTEWYQQAKSSGQTTASNASEWMSDMWESTTASGASISKSTQEWLTAQYLSAKEAGTTSAGSVQQYFQQELAKMGAWEYAVRQSNGSPETSTDMLNELGSLRWECFSVTSLPDGQQVFYFRRKVKSDLDNIPTGDLMKILVSVAGAGLLTGGDGN